MKNIMYVLLFLWGCGKGPKGDPGAVGTNGENAVTPVPVTLEVLKPCGEDSSEALLKLSNGSVLGVIGETNPHSKRLGVLEPNEIYGYECEYSVDQEGNLL